MPEAHPDGLRISYDDSGRGEPALLFMPGWCGSRAVFEQLASRCSTHRRTLALDWRGHGQSGSSQDDFGSDGLVEDALAVIEASGAERIVPAALAHAGWVAIELRRRLAERVPRLVFFDWIITEAPPPFLEALRALQDPERWEQTREELFSMWLHELNVPELTRYVREDMGSYGFEMWARAGREIQSAYTQAGSPLRALAALDPPVQALHLYAQPEDPGYLEAQRTFAAEHPWFSVRRLEARSHFPMLEVPDEMETVIEDFIAS
jgi:pimeloyl-ACP methyl ester carboxylesterase